MAGRAIRIQAHGNVDAAFRLDDECRRQGIPLDPFELGTSIVPDTGEPSMTLEEAYAAGPVPPPFDLAQELEHRIMMNVAFPEIPTGR